MFEKRKLGGFGLETEEARKRRETIFNVSPQLVFFDQNL
jgi:hypothetical protein